MQKYLTITIITAIIICGCGGTDTTISPMSQEDFQKINSRSTITGNTRKYAYQVSKKYSNTVPATITDDTVKGDYGTVTFSGASSEKDGRIMLVLASRFDDFGSIFDRITEHQASDTIFLDKNSKQLLEYRTRLQNCAISYPGGTGSFIGKIRFNSVSITKQTDTTITFDAPYNMNGLLQASEYDWNLDENATLSITFKK